MKWCSTLLLCLLIPISFTFGQETTMSVHYINVDQANAALLEFPCGAILIDAGAQDAESKKHLVKYLVKFFKRRTDLNKTLDLVMVTHCHKDHNSALDTIADLFTIKRYIDNSLTYGSGRANQRKLQREASDRGIEYASYTFEDIIKKGDQKGLTNKIIDPLKCDQVDPKIFLYSSAFDELYEGWTDEDYDNGNNHSLFIKVVFGKSSFLFVGDGENAEMEMLVHYYEGSSALDADVLLVGHHGADNATTDEFLDAVTPKYAVISCGNNSEEERGYPMNAYHHGHPKEVAIEMLQQHIPDFRETPVKISVGLGKKRFKNVMLAKQIYGTPWDGDIIIDATIDGEYTIE